jgi:glucose-fructose oxidoreductase
MRRTSRRDFLRDVGLGGAALTLAPHVARAAPGPQPESGAQPLGYAVIGLGTLAVNEVLPALLKTKHSRLTALITNDLPKAKELARQYHLPEKSVYYYTDYDKIAGNPEIDVVYIALPNNLHAEYTVRAARAGKHVLCEKPMATTVKDSEEMLAACRQAGRRLMIAYRLQFEPYTLATMKMLRANELGRVKMIDAQFSFVIGDPNQWRLKKVDAGGGSMMDIGIYCLQAARLMTGEEPVSVHAEMWSADPVKFREVEENISFTLKFPSGVVAQCYSSYGADLSNRFRVACEGGWVEMEPAYVYRSLVQRVSRGGRLTVTQPSTWDHFALEMDAFSQAIREGRDVSASGEDGLRDMKIITACYESAETGRAVICG